MRDYGKVYSRIWESADFRSLTEDGRALVMYLLTCQHGTIAGVFRIPDGYACEDLQWTSERVAEGFRNITEKGFATRCDDTKWVWVTKFLEWNPPENPNQRKAAAKVAHAVPDGCAWKREFMRVCAPSLGIEPPQPSPPPANPSQTVPEPLLNQYQEQKQEQEQKQDQGKPAPRKRSAPPAVARPEDVTERTWADWLQLRKAKRAPVTETVVNGARTEAAKAGLSMEDFLQVWCRRGSQGLEAAWLRPEERGPARAPPAQSFAERDREAGMQRWEEMTGRVHPDRHQQPGAVVIDLPPHQPIAIGGRS